jgi:hypothetical protein
MEDYELSTEIGYATAFLQKCTPHAVREIGFGFDQSTGKHAFLLHLKQLSYEQVGVAWRSVFRIVPRCSDPYSFS